VIRRGGNLQNCRPAPSLNPPHFTKHWRFDDFKVDHQFPNKKTPAAAFQVGVDYRRLGRFETSCLVFAATPAEELDDRGLYASSGGQLIRLTTPEELPVISVAAPGKPIRSLSRDTQQTTAFIAPTTNGNNTAIYVTALP
jgi:hypothetical protein